MLPTISCHAASLTAARKQRASTSYFPRSDWLASWLHRSRPGTGARGQEPVTSVRKWVSVSSHNAIVRGCPAKIAQDLSMEKSGSPTGVGSADAEMQASGNKAKNATRFIVNLS